MMTQEPALYLRRNPESIASTSALDVKRSLAGMTLVELIIAVVIIAVLAMFVISVVNQSLKSASKTKCVNNLRQIGAASQLYSADHGGNIVYAAQQVGTSSFIYWYSALSAYMGNGLSSSGLQPVFRCPTAIAKHDLKTRQGKPWMGTTYSVTAGGPCPHQSSEPGAPPAKAFGIA